MLQNLIILLVSLGALLYSADALIDTVVRLAKSFNVSSMAIGLTVVAIGTSLPELMVSAEASYGGHSEIALANVLGSNVCNVGLILGLPALFFPITCAPIVIKREGMLMLIFTGTLWGLLGLAGGLGFWTGVLFVL